MSKLHELSEIGQSVWLDYIDRDLIMSGDLDDLISQGLRGITSNPKIFHQAISESNAYQDQMSEFSTGMFIDPQTIYEELVIKDIQSAADRLRSVYDETNKIDGYVSLEVNPHLAYDTNETIEEVKRLYKAVNRPNVMFKVPATNQGVVAVRQLISEGYNINITLMFSLSHYNAVAQAYIDGLEDYYKNGGDISNVASVASFFLSRIDVKLDPILEEKGASDLRGQIAIANAKTVYKRFREMFSGERWEKLVSAGASVQRPLWASTSTKNPAYPDTLYIDHLIGPDTVNTMPQETLNAFLDHGTVATTVDRHVEQADQRLVELVKHDINLLEIGEELQREGVQKFVEPYDALIETIDEFYERAQ